MTCANIIASLTKHISLTKEESELVASKFRIVQVKRKKLIMKEGQAARDVAFVLSGCLRSYSVDENGFEHILQFAPVDWWITDMYSFISQKPAFLNVEAITDSEVALLSRADQLDLFDKVPKLERYFRILTENSLVSSRQRLIDNMSLTAKQRYSIFCNTYPSIINDIPQKLIAEYIGVTPEFLSKMRSELLRSQK
ncbi:MAG: Crp/Fnr family transcriptional regulator [Sphingobacteriia bacterium]|nr:Crp/Fnr family transcriptional regulator [Sphingobacteriia bacterium]